MAEEEYVHLMYFYRSFFKEIFGEAMDLMGRRGVLAILRASARKFAENKIVNYKVAQNSFLKDHTKSHSYPLHLTFV